jgi:hypothetical protein
LRPYPYRPTTRIVFGFAQLLLIALAFLVGCDQHLKGNPRDEFGPIPETVVADSLIFTRSGGTVVTTGTTPLVCCGLFDPGFANEHAIRIVMYDPANSKPGWEIIVLTDRAQAGATTTLPTVVVPPSKIPYVSMFVADLGNELSSDTQGSSGTITVHSFTCSPTTIQIDFNVDATLGSEFAGGPSMDVKGRFLATFPKVACP